MSENQNKNAAVCVALDKREKVNKIKANSFCEGKLNFETVA